NPGDSRGASEWLVMSAVVIRESNEPDALQWLKTIIEKLKQPQRRHLHFRQLRDDRKEIVCREIAALNVRLFCVISNKRNMRGYRNLSAEKAKVYGVHPGFRANHAKGIVAEGTFKASADAATLSKAAIFDGATVPVTVRFSDSGGLPNVGTARQWLCRTAWRSNTTSKTAARPTWC
ncbi:MAG: hypothetical protein ACREC1_00400, partial [Methylovirgula sp.]